MEFYCCFPLFCAVAWREKSPLSKDGDHFFFWAQTNCVASIFHTQTLWGGENWPHCSLLDVRKDKAPVLMHAIDLWRRRKDFSLGWARDEQLTPSPACLDECRANRWVSLHRRPWTDQTTNKWRNQGKQHILQAINHRWRATTFFFYPPTRLL